MTKGIRSTLKLAAAIAAVAGATGAHAAYTGTITANANIISPIVVTQGAPLEFGTLSAGLTSGTLAITASATPTITPGGGVTTSSHGATRTAAQINLAASAAESGYVVTISTPTGPITLTSTGGTMTVDNFSVSAATVALDGTGHASYYVGGTLNVGAAQAAGAYSGTFTASVDYQ